MPVPLTPAPVAARTLDATLRHLLDGAHARVFTPLEQDDPPALDGVLRVRWDRPAGTPEGPPLARWESFLVVRSKDGRTDRIVRPRGAKTGAPTPREASPADALDALAAYLLGRTSTAPPQALVFDPGWEVTLNALARLAERENELVGVTFPLAPFRPRFLREGELVHERPAREAAVVGLDLVASASFAWGATLRVADGHWLFDGYAACLLQRTEDGADLQGLTGDSASLPLTALTSLHQAVGAILTRRHARDAAFLPTFLALPGPASRPAEDAERPEEVPGSGR